MSPLDLASAAVEQQRRLAKDAQKRLEQATTARATAEAAHSKADAEHA